MIRGLLISLMLTASPSFAGERAIDLISELAGTWVSIPQTDDEEPAMIRYEVVANGHSVVEHLFGMVTVYHVDGNRTLATHYCSAGNQPRMAGPLELDQNRYIKFDFVDVTNDSGNGYITGVAFKFVNPNRFEQTWWWTGPDGEANHFTTVFAREGSIQGYLIQEEDRESTLALVEETQVSSVDAVSDELARILPAVYSELAAQGLDPDYGRPFSRYLSFTPDAIEFQAGLPVAQEITASSPFSLVEIPGGAHATTTHYGDLAALGDAYEALHAWMEANGKTPAGAPFEIYVDDPTTTPPSLVRTQIFYPVR